MSVTAFHPAYLSLETRDDVIVAAFTVAHLDDDENIEQLGHEIFSLVDEVGCRKLVLDLSRVDRMASIVVGKTITLHRKLHRREGMLVLCGLSDTITRILATSGLLDYFNVADNVEAAVDAVK